MCSFIKELYVFWMKAIFSLQWSKYLSIVSHTFEITKQISQIFESVSAFENWNIFNIQIELKSLLYKVKRRQAAMRVRKNILERKLLREKSKPIMIMISFNLC